MTAPRNYVPYCEEDVNTEAACQFNFSNKSTGMHFHIKIPVGLKNYFQREINLSAQAYAKGELAMAWRHLERAHILGQAYPLEHSYAHWKMLQFGFRIKSVKEIRGQLLRLLVGGIKSFVGKVPVGNTGGADVPPLQPMEIPQDLSKILNMYQ